MNRHGLLQELLELGEETKPFKYYQNGCPVWNPCFWWWISKKFSGITKEGERKSFGTERHAKDNIPFTGFWLSLARVVDSIWAKWRSSLRATISEFGPVLFSRILNLNDTQVGVISIVSNIVMTINGLLDHKDIKRLSIILNGGKRWNWEHYGKISTSTTGTTKKKVSIRQQRPICFLVKCLLISMI
jgi:hypothetical protein